MAAIAMLRTKQLSRAGGRLLFAALLLGLWAAPVGCGEDIDEGLCTSAAGKICPKWFDCWPDASQEQMGTVNMCLASWDTFCGKADSWTRCDIENDDIQKCDDGVEAADCGAIPYECNKLKDCHDAN
jgi:hypothetical protein